ncbi:hypothetical protein RRG08_006705 [Elysia crispata]|uniref:Fibrinogen C-terminal domain-containing protein n=1 Tax=Elysia crispata TaxID=231223 RepID=A0AAE1D619_9GAST|nr:hypothetical protein RRG08_006705 [Elysia crispata]
MGRVLIACILACLVTWCQGLDFTLNNTPAEPGSPGFCAALTCAEDVTISAFLAASDDQADSFALMKNISNMSIFKRVPGSSGTQKKQNQEVLVAFVSSENPTASHITNDTVIEGTMEAERATVRMVLGKQDDCQSYVKQLRSSKYYEKCMEMKIASMEGGVWGQRVHLFQEDLNNRSEAIEQRLDNVEENMKNDSMITPKYELSSYNNSVVTQSELEDLLSDSETRKSRDLKAMMSHIVASNVCEKGMLSFLSQKFQYPVTFPKNTLDFAYPCDTVTDGGGWIIIQRRSAGNTDFNRTWDDYKQGFGSFAEDFWLGNDKIRTITSTGQYELRIDLKYNGTSAYAHYSSFSIKDGAYQISIDIEDSHYYGKGFRRSTSRTKHISKAYMLSIGDYSGTAGDSLRDSDGQAFSTWDKDLDSSPGNCAEEYSGGWWFVGCGYTCLNGKWGAGSNKGMEWRDLTGGRAVSFSEMKIRSVD